MIDNENCPMPPIENYWMPDPCPSWTPEDIDRLTEALAKIFGWKTKAQLAEDNNSK